jgi:hypothetical protein
MTTRRDRAALQRALQWGERYQRGRAIILVPAPMPRVGSLPWFEAARRCAGFAQMQTLGLRPWQCPPLAAADKVGLDRYGERANEVELRQRLKRAGLSVYEPDPVAALARAAAACGMKGSCRCRNNCSR